MGKIPKMGKKTRCNCLTACCPYKRETYPRAKIQTNKNKFEALNLSVYTYFCNAFVLYICQHETTTHPAVINSRRRAVYSAHILALCSTRPNTKQRRTESGNL